jgi:hypothetical protein
MSNYTETTNFTALTSVHAVINGAALDLEYGNIATAIATKFDNLNTGYAGPFVMTAGTGSTLTVNGVAASYAATFVSSSTAGQGLGVYIRAGTNSSDYSLIVQNQAANTNYFRVYGDGGVVVGAPTGGDQGVGTVNATGYYLNGAALPVALAQTVVNQTGTTSKSGSTTLSNDSTLVATLAANATYTFQLMVGAATLGSTATNINCNINFSGSILAGNYNVGIGSGSGSVIQNWVVASAVTTLQFNTQNLSIGNFLITGQIQTTSSGTLALAWAPNITTGTACTLGHGAFIVTRVA